MAVNQGSVRLRYLPRSLDRAVSVTEGERKGKGREERGERMIRT